MKFIDKLIFEYIKKRNKIPKVIEIYIQSELNKNVKNGKKYCEFRIHTLESEINFSLEKIHTEIMKEVEDSLKLLGIKTIVKKHENAYYFDEYKFYWD